MKVEFDEEEMEKSAKEACSKTPGKVALWIQKSCRCERLNDIKKNKFLVPENLTIAQLLYVIRKQIHITESTALFVMVNSELPSAQQVVSDLVYKSRRSFLFVEYFAENTFGA